MECLFRIRLKSISTLIFVLCKIYLERGDKDKTSNNI